MIGQGRPRGSHGRAARMSGCWGWRFALLAVLTLAAGRGFAQESPDRTVRLRIAWGGGAEQIWSGRISVDRGRLADPRPLGIEADEPGSMWIADGQLVILQRSPRTYDAVDLLVDARRGARLTIALSAAEEGSHRQPLVLSLADVLSDSVGADLDDRGNRILVGRAPGDTLRVRLPEGPLVFAPGETLQLDLQPHRLPVPRGSKVEIAVELVRGRGSAPLWTAQHDFHVDRPAAIGLQVPLGQEEGAYELVFKAIHDGGAGWATRLRRPLKWKQSVAERRIQLLVLDPQGPATGGTEPPLSQVVEIDPANPNWFERFAKVPQLPGLPRLWKGPLGNDNQQTWQHPSLGRVVRLRPSRHPGDVSWEAYSLPIERPCKPHVLEVRYPSDVAQTLGISIVEPNAAGAVLPIGVDSGVHRVEEVTGRDPQARWLVHRIIFWPSTKAPMVLITNRRNDAPAVYGRIRVLAGWNHLPQAYPVAEGEGSRRVLAAYLDRPLFAESFSATESPVTLSDRSLDDWVTFYQGGSRLVEYLGHVGYSGLMMSVMADASTIYPSDLLEPTPRYDTGALFETGLDPQRKDVLEMLLRMFDRRGLTLIPAMEFAAPLPELEAILRQGGPETAGLVWVGPEGKTWTETHTPRRGLAPYYNVLHPRVQDAMLAVVREMVRRCGRHPSFGGMALQLSAQGYAQLPDPRWGMDDETIARFCRDKRVEVPGTGAERFGQRAEFLAGPGRRAWLEWRAAQLSRFYQRVDQELKAVRPGARLYLAGADMLTGPELQRQLRPALGRRITIAETLLSVGIDVEHYRRPDGPVLLRAESLCPLGPLDVEAVNLEIHQMPDVDQCFAAMPTPGQLFCQQPEQLAIPSFDRKSPFRRTHTALLAQPVASDRQNRRRLVHALASIDAQVMLDGGWLVPLGEEDSIRDLVAAYRRLPAVRFRQVAGSGPGQSAQPVTIRYATFEGQTYVYAANDSPIPATARVQLDAPIGCRLEELSGTRSVRPLEYDQQGCSWTVELEPYDVVAVRLGSPQVRLFAPQVEVPQGFRDALKTRIDELGTRAASLRSPPSLGGLANPGFEQRADSQPDAEDEIPGWATSQKKDVAVELDTTRRNSGVRSVRVRSDGPVACLVSQPFEAPKTGRFSMLVWLRVADARRQPPLRLAVEWERHGRDYRFAPVGLEAEPIGTEWARYLFQVHDLPLEGVGQMRVRFDLMGPGEVWIDDVQLSDLAFSRTELIELSKLITVANSQLQRGQWGDCIRLLEGYWPRFLEANVPLSAEAVARKPRPAPPPETPPRRPERTSGLLGRMKGLLPRSLRF